MIDLIRSPPRYQGAPTPGRSPDSAGTLNAVCSVSDSSAVRAQRFPAGGEPPPCAAADRGPGPRRPRLLLTQPARGGALARHPACRPRGTARPGSDDVLRPVRAGQRLRPRLPAGRPTSERTHALPALAVQPGGRGADRLSLACAAGPIAARLFRTGKGSWPGVELEHPDFPTRSTVGRRPDCDRAY